MEMINAFAAFRMKSDKSSTTLLPSFNSFPKCPSASALSRVKVEPSKLPAAVCIAAGRRSIPVLGSSSLDHQPRVEKVVQLERKQHDDEEEEEENVIDIEYEQLGAEMPRVGEEETVLYSISPLSVLLLAALPGAASVRSLFGPFVELVKSWDLPGWLVHWGHPGNMAVVLFAMGGYGTYLGFRIRFSDDVEEKAKAKDLHPKLLAGMFFFFALGATGGVTSLLTSDRPILESPHAVTGLIGLALLTIQTILPTLFEGNPGLRNLHGILGSGIMTLFLVHAVLGLQLGLSY